MIEKGVQKRVLWKVDERVRLIHLNRVALVTSQLEEPNVRGAIDDVAILRPPRDGVGDQVVVRRDNNLDPALRERPQAFDNNLRKPGVQVRLGLVPDENSPLTERSVGDQVHYRGDLSQSLGQQVCL